MANGEEHLKELVGRVFTDQNFAREMERDPEKALGDAGYKLNDEQRRAIQSGRAHVQSLAGQDPTQVAAFVRPVVSVLTKGTRPAVQVVVSSAVVASAGKAEEKK